MNYRVKDYNPQSLYTPEGKERKHPGWATSHRNESGRFLGEWTAIVPDKTKRLGGYAPAVLRLYMSLSGQTVTACFWDHKNQAQGSAKVIHGDTNDAVYHAMRNAGVSFEQDGGGDWKPMYGFGGDPADLLHAWAEHQGLDAYIHHAHP